MSERIGELNFYGDNIEINTDNTSLWTHVNEPHLDHVYMKLPERYNDGELQKALKFYRALGQTAMIYELIAPALQETDGAELHLNIRKAFEVDRDEYETAAVREAGITDWDGVPEGWE